MRDSVLQLAAELGIPQGEMPNDDQIKAIGTLDGPVVVIAGPGTGKTQLLSLRVANILKQKDVSAENVLCLTFTNAGAEAMSRRLLRYIGADAYKVQIGTFHSFAASIRNEYPQFFGSAAFASPITSLQSSILVDRLLQELPYGGPIPSGMNKGVHNQLGGMNSFIKAFKKSSITPDEFRDIVKQSKGYLEYLEGQPEFIESINKATAKDKRYHLDRIMEILDRGRRQAPKDLTKRLVQTPGVYQPYADYLFELFDKSELIEPEGEGEKTAGFQKLRSKIFERDENKYWCGFKKDVLLRALSAIDVYEGYCESLRESELYDYDDMILDTIKAIEDSEALRHILQDRYQYIQVDEFQDTNGVQMRLIDALCEGITRPNLLIVGDDDQSIMRFQGASVEFINQFEDHFPNVQRVVLNVNYRSTSAVVELGQVIAKQITNRSDASEQEKELRVSDRQKQSEEAEEHPRQFNLYSYPNDDLQYFAVARSIRQRIDEGYLENSAHPGEEIAVIARQHNHLLSLIPYLRRFGVPFSYTYTTSVSKIISMQTLLAVLNFAGYCAAGKTSRAQAFLPQILAAPELGISKDEFIEFAFEAKEKRLGNNWLKALEESGNHSIRKHHAWLSKLVIRAATEPLREAIMYASQPLLAYYRDKEDHDPIILTEFNYGLRALLDFVTGELNGYDHGLSEKPLRLPDLIRCFADADRFGVEVKVEVPVEREAAIRLTSAHSSKGLEFDLVYLINADDHSWHSGGSRSGGLIPGNFLFVNENDDNDDRRLLFVAVTRARYELITTRGKEGTVGELVGELCEQEEPVTAEDVLDQSEVNWKELYRIDNDDLIALTKPHLERVKISASTLNRFVEYRHEGANSKEFAATGLLRIPEAPSSWSEFGTCVHEFFEHYVKRVIVGGEDALDELVVRCKKHIASLDFEKAELGKMESRFDRIVESFLPTLADLISGTPICEGWVNAMVGDVPLTGACDLLVLNEADKTIRCFDYKTTNKKPRAQESRYIRQLQFYRLLLENSERYAGWKLEHAADLYVEPMTDMNFQMMPISPVHTSDEELEHLTLLVKAVYWRIQNGLFDTSEFEESELFAEVAPKKFNASGEAPKDDYAAVQRAYEEWLIREWQVTVEK